MMKDSTLQETAVSVVDPSRTVAVIADRWSGHARNIFRVAIAIIAAYALLKLTPGFGSLVVHGTGEADRLILYIVGDHPTPKIRQMANATVVVTGRVPDVTPYLVRAALVVVPLRFCGGMRVKVLEALAAGKAVVASPLALEGLDVMDGKHVLLADSDRQFSDATVQLLTQPERRTALAAQARSWARANLDWEVRSLRMRGSTRV